MKNKAAINPGQEAFPYIQGVLPNACRSLLISEKIREPLARLAIRAIRSLAYQTVSLVSSIYPCSQQTNNKKPTIMPSLVVPGRIEAVKINIPKTSILCRKHLSTIQGFFLRLLSQVSTEPAVCSLRRAPEGWSMKNSKGRETREPAR